VNNKKPEITFKYTYDPGYSPKYVNGAQGGFSPRGEMVIHFYMERQRLPDSMTHEVTPDGTIGREIAIDPPDMAKNMERHIDAGVVMSYENARIFHSWMGEKLQEIEVLQKAHAAFENAPAAGQA
jgi:hypothetical protein